MTEAVQRARPAPQQPSRSVPAGLVRATDLLSMPAELAVLFMMLHVVFDMVAGALFKASLEGMVESVTHLYMVLIAILPLAAIEARSQHLRVAALTERASPRVVGLLAMLARALTVVVCAFIAWLTARQALYATQIGDHIQLTHWSLPIWPVRWAFPAGFALMAFVALSALPPLIRDLRAARRRTEE